MEFDELLKNLWFFDSEVFVHDCLFVFKNYETKERVYFHNSTRDELYSWINKTKPILCGYNSSGYDKYILKGWLAGMSPEELKTLNDHIINGGNGWDIDYGNEYIELPYIWDLMGCIKTFKSLKELEGNLRLNIVETTIDFTIDHKLNDEEFEEVLYYCTNDVDALFPIFKMLMTNYKSKYIIAKIGNIEPAYALSLTDANLTAKLLGAKKKTHKDNFAYVYPSVIDKNKIPKEMINYIDDIIEHNDLEYKPNAPCIDYDTMLFQVGVGGCHAFSKDGYYEYGIENKFKCE